MTDKIAIALTEIAQALNNLGNGNAATDMGAVEAHGKFTSEAIQEVAAVLSNLEQHHDRLADAMDRIATTMETRNAYEPMDDVPGALSEIAGAIASHDK